MLWLVRRLVLLFARTVISLRYRVRVHGLQQLAQLHGPILILPNHPGYIDPVIVVMVLWLRLKPRPMLLEGNFLTPVLYQLMVLLQAVRVPDLEHASAEARARIQKAVEEVIEGLHQGQNFILWPSGRAQRDGTERVGATRATAQILQAVPEANVVLVRTRGVWGSSFSYAYNGKAPRLLQVIRRGVALLFANLLFFAPRRRVDIYLHVVDRREVPELTREALNPWLEKWYNAEGPETPTFVPYHFLFGPRTHEFPPLAEPERFDLDQVKPETRAAVAEILAQKVGRTLTEQELQPDTPLEQFGLDSLDRQEITLTIEHRFGITGDGVPTTIGELWGLAQGLVQHEPPKPPPPSWFLPLSDQGPLRALGETIPEAFVAQALAHRKDVIVADDLAGVLTCERLLVGALTLSRRFAKLPEANIGLLMPASVASDIAFLALQLAGKLPVLLNWTTGPANLGHAARLMKLGNVITSRAFIDRSGVAVEGVQYVFLEDLRQKMGRLELLRTLLTVRFLPGVVRARVPGLTPHEPALVLFTSGSEKAPKAVPLTHGNILSEMRAGVSYLQLTRAHSMLGFLPAFHSFGIAATTLLPILGGMRVVHHPDPTDAARLARKIAAYQPSLLVGTPTFVSYIMEYAGAEDLKSLRLIIVGAERCPSSLYERAARLAPKAALLEGYGITECSPVVAVNRPEDNRPGTVGRPIPGVEIACVKLETERPLAAGQLGMLWVSGPTIFPGYIGQEGPTPFRERDGKRWYVTGDLARVDAEGFIHLAGRLKRFLKAGGEMISLPALEEPFTRRYPPGHDGPRVAVEGVEIDGGCRVVLFTTEDIGLADANQILLQEGFRGVMRLDEVRRVEKIPVLGTGKVDYKVLRGVLTGGTAS